MISILKKIGIILCVLFLLPACAPVIFSDVIPEIELPVLVGEPTLLGVEQNFRESTQFKDYWERILYADRLEPWDDGIISADCFLKSQSVIQTLYQARIYVLEDEGEVGYALQDPFINIPDLTKEERLELERQIQAYAKEKGKRYSYLYHDGFVAFAFTDESPELWVHEARKAYNKRPEFDKDIEESEVRLQHQVLIEHAILEMFDWEGDAH